MYIFFYFSTSRFWPIWTCFKIDSLYAKCYCIESLPHFGCQGSHLTICYYHQDLHWCMIQKRSLSVSFLSLPWKGINASHQLTDQEKHLFFSSWSPFICIYTFSAINFQGYCICSVSCYTLFNRFQLPWPLPECLNTTTLFMVSNNECKIRHI